MPHTVRHSLRGPTVARFGLAATGPDRTWHASLTHFRIISLHDQCISILSSAACVASCYREYSDSPTALLQYLCKGMAAARSLPMRAIRTLNPCRANPSILRRNQYSRTHAGHSNPPLPCLPTIRSFSAGCVSAEYSPT